MPKVHKWSTSGGESPSHQKSYGTFLTKISHFKGDCALETLNVQD